MLKNISIVNMQATKLIFSLSVALVAMALLIFSLNFSVSAQQIPISESESSKLLVNQNATIFASTVPTGTSPFPIPGFVPRMRLPIIIQQSNIGTSSLPGTSTVPRANRIYYIPIVTVQ